MKETKNFYVTLKTKFVIQYTPKKMAGHAQNVVTIKPIKETNIST